MQAQFTSLGEGIKAAQVGSEFPANVQTYQKSLKAVQDLRNGYTQLKDGQKEVVAGFNTMMQATGQFQVSTVKVTDANTRFNKSLADSKIGLGQVISNFGKFRQQLQEATTQQTALQKSAVMQWTSQGGTGTADLYIPKDVSSSLTDLKTKYGMINYAVGQIGNATLNWGKNTQWAGRQITAGLSMPIAIAGAGLAKLAINADTQLTQIAKVYNTTTDANMSAAQKQASTEQQLSQVRTESLNNSIQLAQTYGAKVSDTLELESQLAALGKSGQDLYTSTSQVVRIATLGDLDYNTALQMTLTLMNAFHESGQQLGDTFNFINAVENSTSLTTKDIAEALPRVGAAMAGLGMSVQETTVLLTAFKEGGVDATAGANALKTAVARAFDPVPKAQKEFQNLGIDIKSVVKDSGGDFLKFMEELSGLMENLQPMDKLVALKDLFGIQQSNRLLTVINNLGDAMGGKIPAGFSQTATAIKLMNSSAAGWAATANQEIKQFQDSASGKFKIAVASIQAELIKLGQPIMNALAPVLDFISNLIDKFNNAPSSLKTFIASIAILATVAGPLIMLVGLFGNLVGNVMKFGSSLGNLFLKFKPLTEAERAEQELSKMAGQNYDIQSKAVALLAQKMDQLNVIMRGQIEAQRDLIAGADAAAAAQAKLADVNANAAASGLGNVARATQAAASRIPALPALQTVVDANNKPVIGEHGAEFSMSPAETAAYTAAEQSSAKLKENMSEAKADTAVMAEESAKTGMNFGRIATSAGSLAIGAYFLKDMFNSSNGVLGNLVNGGIALTFMSGTIGKIGTFLKGMSGAGGLFTNLSIAAAGKFQSAMDGVSGALGGVKSKFATAFEDGGIKGIAAIFTGGAAGAMLLSAGLGAVAVGLYTLHQHETELSRAQDALNDSSAAFAKTLGAQVNAEKQGASSSSNTVTATKARASALNQLTSQYSDFGAALKSSNGDMEKAYDNAENVALRFKADTNATQDQVREAFEVAMQGAGATPAEIKKYDVKFSSIKLDNPNQVAQSLMDEIQTALTDSKTKINPSGFGGKLSEILSLDGGDSDISDSAKSAAKKAGATFASALQTTDYGPDQHAMGESLTASLNNMFAGAFKNSIQASDPKLKATMKQMGIKNIQELNDAIESAEATYGHGGPSKMQQALLDEIGNHSGSGDAVDKTTSAYESAFKNMRDSIGKSLGYSGDSLDKWKGKITTMAQLLAALKIPTLSVSQAQDGYTKALGTGTKNLSSLSNAQQLQLLNSYRAKAGLAAVTDVTVGFSDAANKAAAASKNAASGAEDMAQAYADAAQVDTSSFVGTSDQYVTMMKNSYSGAIQAATSQASALMQRTQQAQQTAIQNAGDARQAAMQKQQKQQDAAYDAQTKAAQAAADAENKAISTRYKNLGNFYEAEIKQAQDAAKAQTDGIQAQIDAMSKEDTKRQELFDNEKTRIQRLAQLQSNNIDFNSALNSGNLDAAAKVYSNTASTVQGWAADDQQKQMDDASKAAQDTLKGQMDAINKQTQAYVDAIQTQKDSLSDLQQQEEDLAKTRQQQAQDYISQQKQAYDDARQAAEQADQKKTQSALQNNQLQWQDKVATLNLEVAAVTANIPNSKAAYDAQIATIEGLYQKYGVRLQGYGSDWGAYVANALTYNIQQQAAGLQSDVGWSQIGTFINQQLSNGAGWTVDQVATFLKTGAWPAAAAKTTAAQPWIPQNFSGGDPLGRGVWVNGRMVGSHQGGLAGAGLTHSERTGYPLNSPMFSTEYLTLMEQGEFVVNKQAASQHRDVLEAINSGRFEGHHDGGLVGMMGSLVANSVLGNAAVGMMAAQQGMAAAKLTSQRTALNSMVGAAPINVSGNQAIVQQIAASTYGWTGREWDALYAIIMQESGFRNTAQNPTSTAYGMFQFLNSTWGGYGIPKTSDPTLQAIAGLRYIKARYGDPIGAENHEKAYHWYDQGGYLGAGMVGLNGTGKPEPVFTDKQWSIMSSLIANTTTMAAEMASSAQNSGGGNVASESAPSYNVNIDMTGSTISKDVDMEKAVLSALYKLDNKNGRSRTIG